MKVFRFGPLPSSKAQWLRASLLRSYLPDLQIHGSNACDDVQLIDQGLQSLSHGDVIFCGFSAAVFRFLALRASRIPGKHHLRGELRLFQRPHESLYRVFDQLGVQYQTTDTGLEIRSQGWQKPSLSLEILANETSQVASGVLLNCWNLDFDLRCCLTGPVASKGFLELTLSFLREAGLQVIWGKEAHIPKLQYPRLQSVALEPDMSLAFTLSSFGALLGEATLPQLPRSNLQSDSSFIQILQKMNAPMIQESGRWVIRRALPLRPIDVSLSSSPDLFPSLAVLCAFAEGTSRIFDTPQLAFKESNRLVKVRELLSLVGIESIISKDGILIHGRPDLQPNPNHLLFFDPENDHRMAMAAALLQEREFPILISNPNCVSKSFPEFWRYIQ